MHEVKLTMVPVVCVVGKSNSGKTTLLERLIPLLKGLGYTVAAIKHAPHGVDVDMAGKDSWRLAKAGSDLALAVTPTGVSCYQAFSEEPPLQELLQRLEGAYDLVLVEGYKGSVFPKVEVHRQALGPDLVCQPSELAALVTDGPARPDLRCFHPNAPDALVSFLEEAYCAPSLGAPRVSLLVNGAPVDLKPFVRAIIAQGVVGMVEALKGMKPVLHVVLNIAPARDAGAHKPSQ
ncbi:MAG: molybdopterin-guanine dinucleotide biosynthesis protein B [Chloroflexi bacterium]|nr:molybdopterin-guanine dinucleotide biosynthesis protein B [Chloroflexota bacterium]